jgi:DNA-binding response OmpR family regulator
LPAPGAALSLIRMKPYATLDDRHLLGESEHPDGVRLVTPEGQRLLAVDDDEVFLDLMAGTLRAERFNVDVAKTCEDALPQILFHDYSGILLDLILPDANGLSLFRKILRRRPSLASRVIFITGALDYGEAMRFSRLVDNHLLLKPFRLADLVATVRRVIAAAPA